MIGHNATRHWMSSNQAETLRMNFQNRTLRWASLPERIRGMFNLNDPRWGRGDDADRHAGYSRQHLARYP